MANGDKVGRGQHGVRRYVGWELIVQGDCRTNRCSDRGRGGGGGGGSTVGSNGGRHG